jgi:hypothetical protein
MAPRGWEVRSTHLFRIYEDEEEETEDLTARLLVQTTVAGEAEDSFRIKIHGGNLSCDIWAQDVSPITSLRPYRLRLEARGGEVDLRVNTTASAYMDVATLAASGTLTAYVGTNTEDKTADFSRLLGEAKEDDPNAGISIRWTVRAAGAAKIKLVLEALPAPAKQLRRDGRLTEDTTPGIQIKTWPLDGPMASSGLSGPIPVLFSSQPEETKTRLDQDPGALKPGKHKSQA